MPNINKNRNRFSSTVDQIGQVYIGGWGTGGGNYNCFVAPTKCVIDEVNIVSNASSTGQTTATHYSLQVNNVTQSEDLLSAVDSLVGDDIIADTKRVVTPDQNNLVSENDVLQFQVSTTGAGTGVLSMATIAAIIQVRYRPA